MDMIPWSWILTAVGITGLYFAGRRKAWGWGIGIGAQLLWIAYATVTHQWGFYFSALAYGWVYTKNFLQWRNSHAPIDRRIGEDWPLVDIMYIGTSWSSNYKPEAAITLPSGRKITGAEYIRVRDGIIQQAAEDQGAR